MSRLDKPMDGGELQEKIKAIVSKTDPYIIFCANHNMPWTEGNLVDEIMQLIQADRLAREQEAERRLLERLKTNAVEIASASRSTGEPFMAITIDTLDNELHYLTHSQQPNTAPEDSTNAPAA